MIITMPDYTLALNADQGDRPTPGQLTAGQGRVGRTASAFGGGGGYRPPPKPTIKQYRKMRGNPTIAIARMAGFAPVKAAPWTIEAAPNATVPENVLSFVEAAVMPLRSKLLSDLAFALDFGFAAFEKVWRQKLVNGRQAYVLDKLKPLLPEATQIMVLKQTGAFAGLKNQKVLLPTDKSFLFSYDRETDDWYGRSRNENCMTVWQAWEDTMAQIGRLGDKVSGSIPIIKYPEGSGYDATGNRTDNFEHACSVLNSLSRAKGVAMPQHIAVWAHDMLERGIMLPRNFGAWEIDFLEPSSGHTAELLNTLQHLEKLMMRAWLVPERAATEATLAGSRADSGTAADLALQIADDLANDIDEAVNAYIVNPLLEQNVGAQYVDQVVVQHQPLTDESEALIRQVLVETLKQPTNFDILTKVLDLDAMLDRAELPRLADTADVLEEMEPPQSQEAARQVADQLSKMNQEPPNGQETQQPE